MVLQEGLGCDIMWYRSVPKARRSGHHDKLDHLSTDLRVIHWIIMKSHISFFGQIY